MFQFVSNHTLNPFWGGKAEATVSNHIDLIDVQAFGAKTSIIPDNRDSVKADLDGKGKVVVKKMGDKIQVTYKRPWFQWFSFFGSTKLTVYIPEDFQKDMHVQLGSGQLTFSGQSKNHPMTFDDFKLDMGSGSVTLNNLNVAEFSHNGSSGSLVVNHLDSEKSDIDVSSGSVRLNHFTGELKGDLSSGQMNVQMDKLTDSVNIHASSGSIKLDLPDNADFTIDGKASSGNISCDFPLKNEKIENHRFHGEHGSGKHDVNITVSSGNVKVY